METFKGKVRRIFDNAKKAHVAISHSLCEIANEIPDLKICDIVLCQWDRTIKKTVKSWDVHFLSTVGRQMSRFQRNRPYFRWDKSVN